MFKTLAVALAAALCLSVGSAQALTFNFSFDNTPDGVVGAPLVGSGTFSFDGDPGDGQFALTSLSNADFAFDIAGNAFGNANIVTPLANVLVQISTVGTDRVVNFGGSGGGPFAGSLDFINGGGASLSFQPFFGSLYFSDNFFGTYEGVAVAAPIPLPLSLPLLAAGIGALALVRRRTV